MHIINASARTTTKPRPSVRKTRRLCHLTRVDAPGCDGAQAIGLSV